MNVLLLVAASGMLCSPLVASGAEPNDLPNLILESTEGHSSSVPEPHPLLVAGIGSLAILLFALRRR